MSLGASQIHQERHETTMYKTSLLPFALGAFACFALSHAQVVGQSNTTDLSTDGIGALNASSNDIAQFDCEYHDWTTHNNPLTQDCANAALQIPRGRNTIQFQRFSRDPGRRIPQPWHSGRCLVTLSMVPDVDTETGSFSDIRSDALALISICTRGPSGQEQRPGGHMRTGDNFKLKIALSKLRSTGDTLDSSFGNDTSSDSQSIVPIATSALPQVS